MNGPSTVSNDPREPTSSRRTMCGLLEVSSFTTARARMCRHWHMLTTRNSTQLRALVSDMCCMS